MDKQNYINVTDEELAQAFAKERKTGNGAKTPVGDKTGATKKGKVDKLFIIFIMVGVISLVGGVGMIVFSLLDEKKSSKVDGYPDLSSVESGSEVTYSKLTGEPINSELVAAPAYCIQTPNGTDGARPQAGLNTAGVVFEAIAESGITRFAAIYQNPTASIIGPIRSLRIYYLEWDTPFDCAIVHAGGSGDALEAVAHGYKDLTEDYNYMYRGTYGGRLWNNLFTTSAALARFSADHGYNTSEIKGFARMTPTESERSRIDELAVEKLNITQPTTANTSELKPAVTDIALRLGGWADFNVNYHYDAEANRYLRSYESGKPHEVYNCPEGDLGERNPEDACSLVQMAPAVVVAMMVNERRASDNYHEDIDAIGFGDAYVFQNGTAVKATWRKPSKTDQISFTDTDGNEIRLAPGQTFVTAVPNYGGVEY